MSDNLYKDDHATSGVASNERKRHLTTTAQSFTLKFADVFSFPILNEVWHSDKHGGLECVLVFYKDKNALSGSDNSDVQIVVTELKLEIPVFIKTPELAREISGLR